jgi:hypothetical protein
MLERFEVIDHAVWSMQDDDVGWAAVELVEHCRRRMMNAAELLGVSVGPGPASAPGTRFLIRTVRSIVMLMADAYRASWLPERRDLPVIGLSLPLWHQVQWRGFFLAELHDLLDNPGFVRSVLTSALHPDTDLGMGAEYRALVILRLRYGMQVPEYLGEVCVRNWRGGDMPRDSAVQPASPHFWL